MTTWIGVDVSKSWLDVDISGKLTRVRNEPLLTARLKSLLDAVDAPIVVCEASGGFERQLVSSCRELEVSVRVVNAKRVRDFAKALGCNAKTDAVDAKVISRFAETIEPKAAIEPIDGADELKALRERREQLVEVATSERNRLSSLPKQLRQGVERHLKFLEKEVKTLEGQMEQVVKSHAALKRKAELLTSCKGVGLVVAYTLLTAMPELGVLSKKQIAALAGVAPFAKQSGTYIGKATTYGGRSAARKALYMAALSAARYNPEIRTFFKRLVGKGKPKKVALVACMRKLLVGLNAALRTDTPWRYECA